MAGLDKTDIYNYISDIPKKDYIKEGNNNNEKDNFFNSIFKRGTSRLY